VNPQAPPSPRYKWIALSNTTLGILMATINSSIVIISLPAIFRGVKLNPLEAGNVSYLLWMLMGYLLVSAVLAFSAWAVIPIDNHWVVSDINVGILYLFAVSSLGAHAVSAHRHVNTSLSGTLFF